MLSVTIEYLKVNLQIPEVVFIHAFLFKCKSAAGIDLIVNKL